MLGGEESASDDGAGMLRSHGITRLLAATAIALVAGMTGPASAQDRPLKGIALIIGQSDYESLSDLPNPANDAREMQKLLADLGFEVSSATDRDRRRLARELDRFVEDAEEADVALLYYSGHGIEAGGQNFLVPVDAASDALEGADDNLVPIGGYIEELQRHVPVTIVLLDACRTNPFPAGALLKTADTPAGLAVTPSGLGQPRSVTPMRFSSAAMEETFGIVIGYAAEPGKVALDGEPGGNSPYAEALARHLGAMSGEEFGQVLRMVAEEVYLKTGGQQRPWVNESLRRLLYFGASPDEPTGAEGDILRERRKLLLTIAKLGGQTRQQVETIAKGGDVPMDTIYGLLRTLGADAPQDPAELDKLLRGQTEALRKMLDERNAIAATDPEIERLSRLASEAVAEGAITTALEIHEQIKSRVSQLSASLDRAQADIDARRKEFAAAYASSAEAYSLAFDYRRAAADMNSAFQQVRAVDRALAFRYRNNEGLAWFRHGSVKGDNASLARAIEAYRDALSFAPRDVAPADWGLANNNIGVALQELGTRLGDLVMLETSAAQHREALAAFDRQLQADDWAWTHASLGNALLTISERKDDPAIFEEAIAAYHAALEVRTREANPTEWARLQQNMGTGLIGLARRTDDRKVAAEAVQSLRNALTEFTRERIPLEWANTTTNLAAALRLYADLAEDPAALDEAIAAYRDVLTVRTRESVPLGWAMTSNNLGNALLDRAYASKDTAVARDAIEHFRDALKEETREHTPLDWAMAQRNVGRAFEFLYDVEKAPDLIDEAIVRYGTALEGATRERSVTDWAAAVTALAAGREKKADINDDRALLGEVRSGYREAMEALSPTSSPSQWSAVRNSYALATYKLGMKTGDLAMLREAADLHRERLAFRNRARTALDDAQTQYNVAIAMVEIARVSAGADDRRLAAEALRVALPGYSGPDKVAERAYMQSALGDQLIELAQHEAGDALAEEAVAALRAALAESQEPLPAYDPAWTRHQLGRALLLLGDRRDSVPHLAEAEATFLKTAEVWRITAPEDAAIALGNAASAAMAIGQRGEGLSDYQRAGARLDEATALWSQRGSAAGLAGAAHSRAWLAELVAARTKTTEDMAAAAELYAAAGEAYSRAGDRTGQATVELARGNVLLSLSEAKPESVGDAERANSAYAAAADLYGDGADAATVALVHNGLAYSRTLIAEAKGAEADFDAAAASARMALEAQMRSGAPGNLPFIRDTLCRALTGLGGARADKAVLSEAITTCETAISEFRAAGNEEGAAETTTNLARARELLADIR